MNVYFAKFKGINRTLDECRMSRSLRIFKIAQLAD